MLHCTSKLGWVLGIAILLMVQFSVGYLQSPSDFHQARRSSGAARPRVLANEDQALFRHSGHEDYHDEDALDGEKRKASDRRLLDNYHPGPYEMDLHKAQNTSLCEYTVVPIPNPGGRIPRELYHVKCNYKGSKCQDKGSYCCLQTYDFVEVAYESGRTEIMRVYSGCVCALHHYCSADGKESL